MNVPPPIPAFVDRLAHAVCTQKNPVCVGIDPRWENLPPALTAAVSQPDITAKAEAFFTFAREVIDVVAPLVPIIKPQLAFFEQLGPAGMVALAHTIQHARASGLLVLLDGKRNDIGTTAAAYAEAYLGQKSVWQGDALTVSPYLGSDSIIPFVEAAVQQNAGVFVLVKTSNAGGGQFQDLPAESMPLFKHVALYVEELAAKTKSDCGYGAVGAVVGATYPEQLAELRAVMPHAWLLIPGYGAQGAAAADVAAAFDASGMGAIVNSSRGIIFAYERREYRERFPPKQWQAAVESATIDMIAELRDYTPASKLV